MSELTQSRFCTACGAGLPDKAAFCPGCGTGLAVTRTSPAGQAPQTQQARKPSPFTLAGSPLAALAVFALLALAGGGALYFTSTKTPPPRAVSGSAGNGENAHVTTVRNGAMPPDTQVPSELRAEIERALADLQAKADAAPRDEQAWTLLARARYRASQLDPASYIADAETTLKTLTKLAPESTEAARMFGNLEYTRGGFVEAEKHYRRFLELQPGEPNVGTDLASVLLFQGKSDQAKKAFRGVLAEHPDFMQAHFHLGVALHTEGEHDAAVPHLEKAYKLAPEGSKERVAPYLEAARQGLPHAAAVAALDDPRNKPAAPVAKAPSAAARPAESNAESPFQKGVDRDLIGHRIFGPKIASINWSNTATAKVTLVGFPMDQMPPVMRNKFKSTVNEKIALRAEEEGVDEPIDILLVDKESGKVMDRFDGEEMVGAFDESNYE